MQGQLEGQVAPVYISLQVCRLDPDLYAPQYKYTPGGQVTQVLLSKFHKDRAPFGYLLDCTPLLDLSGYHLAQLMGICLTG